MREMRRLLGLLRGHRGWMALGMLLALTVTLANMALLALAGWFIAAMAAAGLAGVSMDYFTPAAGIRALALLRTGGRYLERLVTHDAALRLLTRLRVWFYRHLEPLAPARLGAYHSGDLLSRIRADIDALDNFYLRVLVPSAVALLAALAGCAFLGFFSPRVALIEGGFMALTGLALPALVQRLGTRSGRRTIALESALRTTAVDGVQGLPELLVFGADARHRETVARLSRELVGAQERLSRLSGMSSALFGLGVNLAVWLAAIVVIPLVHTHALDRLDLAMIILLVLASFEAVQGLPDAFQALGATLAAAHRIFQIIDAPPAVADPDDPAPPPSDCTLRCSRLRLRYSADAPWALEDFDLELRAGERVAIVGPTGAGKSSIINVLLRFWDYQGGSASLGGIELRRYRAETLRARIAVVSQRTHLFNTTIRENLRLADPDATEEALQAAARAARIHDDILALPEGYDTYVGEAGSGLSGGQAKRIAIARALLKDAPVLILDEPTEGLDAETAGDLLETLESLMRDRSVLLITHRLVGLQHMDRVLVMEHGRVIETGTHRELLRTPGRYRELHERLQV